jgi:hypothetical protein
MLYKHKKAAEKLGWKIRTLHRYAVMLGKIPKKIGRRFIMLYTDEELELLKTEKAKHERKPRCLKEGGKSKN